MAPVGASGVHAPLPGKLDAEHVLVVPQLRGRTPVRLRERLGEEAPGERRLALARVARLDGPLPVELEGTATAEPVALSPEARSSAFTSAKTQLARRRSAKPMLQPLSTLVRSTRWTTLARRRLNSRSAANRASSDAGVLSASRGNRTRSFSAPGAPGASRAETWPGDACSERWRTGRRCPWARLPPLDAHALLLDRVVVQPHEVRVVIGGPGIGPFFRSIGSIGSIGSIWGSARRPHSSWKGLRKRAAASARFWSILVDALMPILPARLSAR